MTLIITEVVINCFKYVWLKNVNKIEVIPSFLVNF